MATYNLGKFILTPKGVYSATTTYNRLDVVLYNGSSYICKTDETRGKTPTITTYWQLLAQAGQATMTDEQKQEVINGLISQGVVIDPNYQTFSQADKEKLDSLPNSVGEGTLKVFVNNVNELSFNANNTEDARLDLKIPLKINDLNDGDSVKFNSTLFINDETEAKIEKIEGNSVTYFSKPLTNLQFEVNEEFDPKNLINLRAEYYFTSAGDFNILYPVGSFINEETVETDKAYKLTLEGNYFTLTQYHKYN